MNNIIETLKNYQIDVDRGFLPAQDPLQQLPGQFRDWEELAKHLTDYINAGVIREKIEALPIIEDPQLKTPPARERAMLLLSFFAHAYVHSPPSPRNYIPASIAIPWVRVAGTLKRKAILSHSSAVLYNWKRIDPNKPIQLGNLAPLCQFHGGLDENWFYLVTVEIEQVGAKAIPLVLELMQVVAQGDFKSACQILEKVNEVLGQLSTALRKVYTHCDPHIFYLRVRPFLASFVDIDYQGTGLPLQNHHGGSAAQSSLLQFFDAAFGVQYENKATRAYLLLMRQHMPKKHADFLEYIENTSKIREGISKNQAFAEHYKTAMSQIVEFRNEHLKIVALYIMKQANKTQATAQGTGGTNPMVFLKSVRNQNNELL